jgi:hypothetical protein
VTETKDRPWGISEAKKRQKTVQWLGSTLRIPPANSQRTIKALSRHRGNSLCFFGLDALEISTGKALARYKGEKLQLGNLRAISKESAKALAKHRGKKLDLFWVRKLSTDAATALGNHQGEILELGWLEKLTLKAAKALAKHKGIVLFHKINQISDTAIKALQVNPRIKLPSDCIDRLEVF